jgi:hypothetical protein
MRIAWKEIEMDTLIRFRYNLSSFFLPAMPAISTLRSGVTDGRQGTPRRRYADRHYIAVVAEEARRLTRQLRSPGSTGATRRASARNRVEDGR